MVKLLATESTDIWGTVKAPVSGIASDPNVAFGDAIGFGVKVFILVAALSMLIYLMLGAFDWITSSGEKEKITKAQNKITNAVVGLIIVFVAITAFGLITGDILGIVTQTSTGWKFNIPTFGGN